MTVAELKQLAENATPGPWRSLGGPDDDWGTVELDGPYGFEATRDIPAARADAAYIAAANPRLVAALCDVAEAARKVDDWSAGRANTLTPLHDLMGALFALDEALR